MRFLITILISWIPLNMGFGDDSVECVHRPILVKSRPVIERLPLKVIDPIDVAITSFGATIVAERQAGIVFLLTEDGQASPLGDNFKGLERIADSDLTGIHALCTRTSSSTIYRLTDSGFSSEFAELNFAATGLAAGGAGQVWTANPRAGQIILIDAEGKPNVVATVKDQIIDLAADDQGVYVLYDSGQVDSVTADGSRRRVGYVSDQSTRIQLNSNRQVVALAKTQERLGLLLKPSVDKADGRQIGKVPSGTQAFAYDSLGNMTLANPDLRALTRVTSHFSVPCPHCGKPVSMTLSTNGPQKPAQRRSF